MDVRRIAVSIVAAYIFCLGASVSVFAEEPLEIPPSDPVVEESETVLEEEVPEVEEETEEPAETETFVLDEPVEVIVVDVIDDSPVYTVWDKPFNEYQPTEAFTFLIVVFMMLAGMVKFISWAWL